MAAGLAKGEITTSLRRAISNRRKIVYSDFLFSKGAFHLRERFCGRDGSWDDRRLSNSITYHKRIWGNVFKREQETE